MESLKEEYPEVWNKIEREDIPKLDINVYLLRFVLWLVNEIKDNKKNELDIGDAFGIGIQHTKGKYQLNPEVENFLYELGEYKVGKYPYSGSINTIMVVEKEAKELLKKLIF